MPVNVVRDGELDRDAAAAELRGYLEVIFAAARFQLRCVVELHEPAAADAAESLEALETPEIVVKLDGPDGPLLLDRGAELLKALEYLAVRSLRLAPQFHERVRFDCGSYRSDRLAELKLSAQVAADRVRETHAPFRFNAMSARERRIIHLALKDHPGIRTASDGAGDERQVVVFPADSK